MFDAEKQAYDVWAYRTGSFTPWDHLTNTEQIAWSEVVQLLTAEEDSDPPVDELFCEDCGADLVCPVCALERFAVPAATAGKPTAVLTQAARV
jgi:hypothetical protein